MERAEVGPQDFRAVHRRVEVHADDILAAGPLLQPAVAPDDRVVGVEQHDAVGHALQNVFVLEQSADAERFGQMTFGHEDAGVFFVRQSGQSTDRAADFFDAQSSLNYRP